MDEFADAFLHCLHDSTDGGLWDYLRQSSSSGDASRPASDPPLASCTLPNCGSVGSAPANHPNEDEAGMALPEDITSPDTLLEDIVRLSQK